MVWDSRTEAEIRVKKPSSDVGRIPSSVVSVSNTWSGRQKLYRMIKNFLLGKSRITIEFYNPYRIVIEVLVEKNSK